jgi:hypothetical protein
MLDPDSSQSGSKTLIPGTVDEVSLHCFKLTVPELQYGTLELIGTVFILKDRLHVVLN